MLLTFRLPVTIFTLGAVGPALGVNAGLVLARFFGDGPLLTVAAADGLAYLGLLLASVIAATTARVRCVAIVCAALTGWYMVTVLVSAVALVVSGNATMSAFAIAVLVLVANSAIIRMCARAVVKSRDAEAYDREIYRIN